MTPAGKFLLVAAAALVVAPAAAGAAAGPSTHVVVIDKMKFGPVPAKVRVGDTIVWVNKDLFRHTATARNRSFEVDLAPTKTAKTVVRKSGAIPFYCRFHPGMKGQLTVASK